MNIPIDKIEIAAEKITEYLLVKKNKNDKSAFLLRLGYTLENWSDLQIDIKNIVATNEAHLQQSTVFGSIFEMKGKLKNFGEITIWLLSVDTDKFKFIALFPE